MANKFIIECPHCKVRFFVTDELLTVANGMLRCGFCMDVFNSKEQFVQEAFDATELVDSKQPIADDKVPSTIVSSADDVDCSEEYWHEVMSGFDDFTVNFDLLDDETKAKEADVTPSSYVAPTIVAPNIEPNKEEADLPVIDEDIAEQLDQIDWDALLQWDDEFFTTKQDKDIAPPEQPIVQKELEPVITAQTVEEDEVLAVDEPIVAIEYKVATDIYGNKLSVVTEFDFDYVDNKPKVVNRHNIWWGFLSLIAILLLAGQYLRYIAPDMARHEASRGWAEEICQYLFCDIPVLIDVDKIRTEQMVVRSDAQYEGVLDVDAIIYNDLAFFQPYPIIELRFTDLNGQTVASRRFSPDEYLDSEILKQNQMPPSMPVYISLQVIDPGPQVTGHLLQYYPALVNLPH